MALSFLVYYRLSPKTHPLLIPDGLERLYILPNYKIAGRFFKAPNSKGSILSTRKATRCLALCTGCS